MAAPKKIKSLVLVESPSKAKTISKFVGNDAVVKATYGHIRDLPRSILGVDVEDNFNPKYVIPRKASPVVKELKQLAKSAEIVYLATDPDREGEAIAWHVMAALDLAPEKTRRILFHEITKSAIQEALSHPGKLNENLVDAQQARRVLDRLVGYRLSPLLWQKLYRGLSAGRVQSVALRLITDRESAIDSFESTEYWSLTATFTTQNGESFLAGLTKVDGKGISKHPSKELIDTAQKYSEEAKAWIITRRDAEQKQRHPSGPFTTSTIQQEASRKLNFSVKQTMVLAQKLYEGIQLKGETVGLITYMRTDSLNMAQSAVEEARDVIGNLYGKTYIPESPRQYKTKSKGAQEAHEAIRPTSFARRPDDVKDSLSPQEYKLYKLIWERAISSQMASAQIESTELGVGITSNTDALEYVARGYRIIFPGFLKVYEEGTDETSDDESNQTLPAITTGDSVARESLEPKQHFTQPPPRFTEASLVKEMEKLGIGRPSTYAPTLATLADRGYVVKEERKLIPQEVGKIVINLLKEHFSSIVDYDFTAEMEKEFDDVANGTIAWQPVIKEFYGPFDKQVEAAEKSIDKKNLSEEMTEELCPECGKPLFIKLGRFGRFYACSGFPDCRYTRPMEKSEAEQQAEQQLIAGRTCPEDQGQLVVKRGRFGEFIACANYPKCRYIESIKKEVGVPCPKCDGQVIERRSKRGKLFYGCSNYPKCDFVSWDKPLDRPCPKCKGLLVEKKKGIVCVNGDYTEEVKDADEAISAPVNPEA